MDALKWQFAWEVAYKSYDFRQLDFHIKKKDKLESNEEEEEENNPKRMRRKLFSDQILSVLWMSCETTNTKQRAKTNERESD